MTQSEQILALSNELDRLIDRFRHEYDISVAAVVGVLEMHKHEILDGVLNGDYDDSPDAGD